ncbi:hypothetical protein HDU96_006299 [Phlyctochytrium bullatum]|nr:hypothetical protein HDU96_006299 [Phlyctochytrium bullatum]
MPKRKDDTGQGSATAPIPKRKRSVGHASAAPSKRKPVASHATNTPSKRQRQGHAEPIAPVDTADPVVPASSSPGSTPENPLSRADGRKKQLQPWPFYFQGRFADVPKPRKARKAFDTYLATHHQQLTGRNEDHVTYICFEGSTGFVGVKKDEKDKLEQLFQEQVLGVMEQQPDLGSAPDFPLTAAQADEKQLHPWQYYVREELALLNEGEKEDLQSYLAGSLGALSGSDAPVYIKISENEPVTIGLPESAGKTLKILVPSWSFHKRAKREQLQRLAQD